LTLTYTKIFLNLLNDNIGRLKLFYYI